MFTQVSQFVQADLNTGDAAHLEEERIEGAIKTDFILSAEIMTIALGALPPNGLWLQAATLTVVAVDITIVIYGSIALIVKADDVDLYASRHSRLSATHALGRGIVKGRPSFLVLLTGGGTAAMLWMGGSIVIHGLLTVAIVQPGHFRCPVRTHIGRPFNTAR